MSHLPTWTTADTHSYSLPPQCRCPYNRQCLFLPHFSLPFVVSSHYRSPTYRSRALPLRTMSSSSNKLTRHRHRPSSLPFQQSQPTESAAAELARAGLIQPRRHRPLRFMSLVLFALSRAITKEMFASIPPYLHGQQPWRTDIGNICRSTS